MRTWAFRFTWTNVNKNTLAMDINQILRSTWLKSWSPTLPMERPHGIDPSHYTREYFGESCVKLNCHQLIWKEDILTTQIGPVSPSTFGPTRRLCQCCNQLKTISGLFLSLDWFSFFYLLCWTWSTGGLPGSWIVYTNYKDYICSPFSVSLCHLFFDFYDVV